MFAHSAFLDIFKRDFQFGLLLCVDEFPAQFLSERFGEVPFTRRNQEFCSYGCPIRNGRLTQDSAFHLRKRIKRMGAFIHYCSRIFHGLLKSAFDESIDSNAGCVCIIGNGIMGRRRDTDIQSSGVTFTGSDAFFFTESKIIIDSLLEGFRKLLHAFSLKMNKRVNPENPACKSVSSVVKRSGSDESFIFQCFHNANVTEN